MRHTAPGTHLPPVHPRRATQELLAGSRVPSLPQHSGAPRRSQGLRPGTWGLCFPLTPLFIDGHPSPCLGPRQTSRRTTRSRRSSTHWGRGWSHTLRPPHARLNRPQDTAVLPPEDTITEPRTCEPLPIEMLDPRQWTCARWAATVQRCDQTRTKSSPGITRKRDPGCKTSKWQGYSRSLLPAGQAGTRDVTMRQHPMRRDRPCGHRHTQGSRAWVGLSQ